MTHEHNFLIGKNLFRVRWTFDGTVKIGLILHWEQGYLAPDKTVNCVLCSINVNFILDSAVQCSVLICNFLQYKLVFHVFFEIISWKIRQSWIAGHKKSLLITRRQTYLIQKQRTNQMVSCTFFLAQICNSVQEQTLPVTRVHKYCILRRNRFSNLKSV